MPFLSDFKPVHSIERTTAAQDYDYSSSSFTIMKEDCGAITTIPPYETVHIPQTDSFLTIIEFDNAGILLLLEDHSFFSEIKSSDTHPSLLTLSERLDLLQSTYETHNVLSGFIAFVEEMNRLFPVLYDYMPQAGTSGRLQALYGFLKANLFSSISLNSAADFAGLTPQYIASHFKKTYDMTFTEFANHMKAEYCLPLVRFTELSRESIAHIMGFHSTDIMEQALIREYRQSFHTIRKEHTMPCVKRSISSVSLRAKSMVPAVLVKEAGSAKDFDSVDWHLDLDKSFLYGRVTDLLELVTVEPIGQKSFLFFDRVFAVLDFLLEVKLIPHITITSCDYLSDFLQHVINRYCISEVSTWRFEFSGISSTRWQYQKNYTKFKNTILKYIPRIKPENILSDKKENKL